jgi:hypothetical protein
MTAPTGLDRATLALGAASVLSAALVFASEEWEFIRVHRGAALVALVLGVLAGVAGWFANRLLTLTAGVLFLLAAAVLLVLLALHGNGGYLDGSASTFSLWLGLGIGLVVLGLTPRDTTT